MTEWECDGLPHTLWTGAAFRQIGRAIASKCNAIAQEDLKCLFQEVERLLTAADPMIANAVATGMLEAIWKAAHESGFDFATIDPHLGREARRYLLRWDEFNRTTTPGLTRR
jgi:hypothetical protein